MEGNQLYLNMHPRIPISEIVTYNKRIGDLMDKEEIPSTYAKSNSERALFVYNNEDNGEWVQVFIQFEGEKGSMEINGKYGSLERKIREIVPINEHGIVQNKERVAA